MQNKDLALKAAGVIFILVAIMHLLRFVLKMQVVIANVNMRLNASLIASVVALLLAVWMFAASKE